jgi:hypothetical protein
MNSALTREATLEIRIAGKDFYARTRADNAQVRVMEALGVISPSKTPSGWRQYSEADVAAACAWLATHTHPRRRREPQRRGAAHG